MITPSKFRIIILATLVTLTITSNVQAEEYEWLKSPGYESIFVFTEFNGCDFIADKLNETVKRTFSRSNIKATLSNSLVFQTTDNRKNSTYELVDDNLTGSNKIILHIYGKCIKYSSGFVYQFDINFGVNDTKYSQALLYSTPQHSVIGVDSIMGIERNFRMLMRNVVDDYCSANQDDSESGRYVSEQ
jgi:hypothetical protein